MPGEGFARARSDGLSPAFVSDLPSFSRSQFPIEAEEPPEGYDLGPAFSMFAPNITAAMR